MKRYTKNMKGLRYWHGIHPFLDTSGVHTGIDIQDTFSIGIINDSTIDVRGTKLYSYPELRIDSNTFINFSSGSSSVPKETTAPLTHKKTLAPFGIIFAAIFVVNNPEKATPKSAQNRCRKCAKNVQKVCRKCAKVRNNYAINH